MNVRDIIVARLKQLGADGLCCEDCGCGLDDIVPCQSDPSLCVPAKAVEEGGETIYVPVDEAKGE